MADTDSFVEEVSEEIRRDRMFGFFKKYGWVIALILAAIIGGAIYNEWRKVRIETARQETGDGLLAAIKQDTPQARASALAAIAEEGTQGAHLALFGQAAALAEAEQSQEAIAIYEQIASDGSLSNAYRDLARLKSLMLDPASPDADQVLEVLIAPGRPYRPLALELRAQMHLEAGDTDAALADLVAILEAAETSAELRQRAQQLTIVLGGEIPESAVLLPENGDG